MGDLYADGRVRRPETSHESGPPITSTDVQDAIKQLKNNTTSGTYLIAAEMMDQLKK